VVNRPEGVVINADLELPYGIRLPEAARRTQQQIARMVEHMTALNVLEVNLTVKRLFFPNLDPPASGAGGDGRRSSPTGAEPP
jgi:uncharacterized alkaline shock family protein YloU